METMTMRGVGSGVVVDDWADYEVGELFPFENDEYLIVRKESLSKCTDGIYAGRPAFLVLRGFKRKGKFDVWPKT